MPIRNHIGNEKFSKQSIVLTKTKGTNLFEFTKHYFYSYISATLPRLTIRKHNKIM